MEILPNFPHESEHKYQLAVSAFVAGLPDLRRGRIVTASSNPNAWRAKHPAIERRLAGDRAEVVRP
ncbi:MAG: hypothetical protein M0038_04955 [Pseudomonadota bacterium]|jgi:hypothetical protein|nr:hypothetical protein [Pseudomonadota bacterium]